MLTTDDYPAETINGYPVLNATSLDTLADSVAAAGITRIDGNIVGDGSRYDDEFFHPSWPEDIHVTEAGPLDALLVNDARFLTDDWQVANDPNAGAAEELGRLLEERGITIGGEVTTGTAPADAPVIASIDSAAAAGGDRRDAGVERQQHGRAARSRSSAWPAAAAARRPPGPRRRSAALAAIGLDTTGVVVDDGVGVEQQQPGHVPAARRDPRALRAGRPVRRRTAGRRPGRHDAQRRVRRFGRWKTG